MSRRATVSTAAWLQLAGVIAVAVAIASVLAFLRSTAPTAETTPTRPGVEDPLGAELDTTTCRRTQPDVATGPPPGKRPEPTGIVHSTEVVACPQIFDPDSGDGPTVMYVGEVVGDVLERDGGAWALINDDAYALEDGPLPAHNELAGTNSGLTVWLPDNLQLGELDPGRPARRGDILSITGRISRSDPHDGGGLTLRATSADLVVEAQSIPPPWHSHQAVVAAAVTLAAVVLTAYQRSRGRT